MTSATPAPHSAPDAGAVGAISAQQLRKSFGDVDAVRGVDLQVAEGEIYGFLGPNGAGKSTVVKMLTTLITPSAGSARVLGHDLVDEAADIRLRIGVALQDASLDKKMSGRELLRLQGSLYGLTRPEIDRRIDDLAHLIEFEAIDRNVETYSGGMERRLDLAASLMHSPELLFLDEPTTGLDPTSRAAVWQEVRRLNTELGTTIFLTTQYLEEADELADRVGIINDGTLVAEGTPTELKKTVGTDVIAVRVSGGGAADIEAAAATLNTLESVDHIDIAGDELLLSVSDGAAAVSPVAVALDATNVDVSELTLRTPSLDDVFLELTGGRIEVGA